MSGMCPDRDEILKLIDGEQTANRAEAIQRHLAECASCRAELESQRVLLSQIAAPLEESEDPAAVKRLMARLELTQKAAPQKALAFAWKWPLGLSVAAIGLAAVLIVNRPRPADLGQFAARGEARQGALDRTVGISLYAVAIPPRELVDGSVVSRRTQYMARYRNRESTPVFALVFGVDRRGDIYWLFPGFNSPEENPRSLQLAPGEAVLPDTVLFADVPQGLLEVITLVSPEPMDVRAVESLPVSERTAAGLSARYPHATVEHIDLQVQDQPGLPTDKAP
jgi:hypothetical protein